MEKTGGEVAESIQCGGQKVVEVEIWDATSPNPPIDRGGICENNYGVEGGLVKYLPKEGMNSYCVTGGATREYVQGCVCVWKGGGGGYQRQY